MPKTIMFALAMLAAVAGFSAPSLAADGDAPMTINGATTVDAEGIIGLFDAHPDLIVLDNRKETDFDAGHIEGAVRLVDTDVSADSLAAVVPTKETPILMYCNGIKCGRAANAVEKAIGLGYTKIFYYAKGMEEWKERNLPLMTN